MAGALWAQYVGFVDPFYVFSIDLSLRFALAAILGGIGSVPGAMLAGLIVGLSEAVAVQVIGAEWRAAIAFAILVLVLLLRPQGLFGRAE